MTTIGELHGLDQHDPWRQPSTARQQRREALSRRWFDIAKQLPDEDAPFTDPPDDESMTIGERSQSFWRVTVAGHRLGDVVEVVPHLPTISYVMRNNKAGCWVALTSRRVAQRTVQHLRELGMDGQIDPCNETGNALQDCKQPAGITLYCIGIYRDGVRAYFVPQDFWDRYQHMPDEHDSVLAGRLEPHFHQTDLGYCFRTDLALARAKQLLDNMDGFQESLLVQACVNEVLP